ncbi:hypothetical protein PPL_12070 [Heterostelium album PN500]|uniref:Uncharacterized protein n=1 Tax=Heterostelium pallidum (strain ATCC 26659 / Pp 5 / PN500) TaxID=670386 RepID=D3BLL7_HETP5|nr:hypothetical protein PPL_12070 [Heterostelium album PN500]EFA77468.1 hypothetical protein PPL_12070 [Heterostelium album PN500]|eukprot:XP_020429596.1 hypothetical protein PPL_12070 [Heterostelium album PN500]
MATLCEDSILDSDYDFNGKNIMFIRRQFKNEAWKLDLPEQHSPNGETKIIIKNPTQSKFLACVRFQGNTNAQTSVKSYVDDVNSLETLCNHNGHELLPIALELNEVSQDSRMVIEFKFSSKNKSGLNNGSITGFIMPLNR